MADNLTIEQQKNLILGILNTFLEDLDNLGNYIDHVGFDIGMIADPEELPRAWLGFYRIRRGQYDVDRACNDLAAWPPIAARIAYLRAERDKV